MSQPSSAAMLLVVGLVALLYAATAFRLARQRGVVEAPSMAARRVFALTVVAMGVMVAYSGHRAFSRGSLAHAAMITPELFVLVLAVVWGNQRPSMSPALSTATFASSAAAVLVAVVAFVSMSECGGFGEEFHRPTQACVTECTPGTERVQVVRPAPFSCAALLDPASSHRADFAGAYRRATGRTVTKVLLSSSGCEEVLLAYTGAEGTGYDLVSYSNGVVTVKSPNMPFARVTEMLVAAPPAAEPASSAVIVEYPCLPVCPADRTYRLPATGACATYAEARAQFPASRTRTGLAAVDDASHGRTWCERVTMMTNSLEYAEFKADYERVRAGHVLEDIVRMSDDGVFECDFVVRYSMDDGMSSIPLYEHVRYSASEHYLEVVAEHVNVTTE